MGWRFLELGSLAARHVDTAIPLVLLRRTRHLPSARRTSRQPRWSHRGPASVPGLHARGHERRYGLPRPVCSGAGPRSSRPRYSPSSAPRCTWARSPPTTRCRCSWSRWPPGCVVRAGDRQDVTGWMLAAGAALALANATSYSSALFDPVRAPARPGHRLSAPGGQGRRRASADPAGYRGGPAHACAVLIGGSRYLHGINVTTLQRAPGTFTGPTIFAHFWSGPA